jgi:hypothetical protein
MSEAVGFLNGRCWEELLCFEHPLAMDEERPPSHDPISLRELEVGRSAVSDAGITGLEAIPHEVLTPFVSTITNVTNLFRSKSLRKLVL